jgi:hypothetical protein
MVVGFVFAVVSGAQFQIVEPGAFAVVPLRGT